jgi:serine protease Do
MKAIRYREMAVGIVLGVVLASAVPVINMAGAVDRAPPAATAALPLGPSFADIVERVSPAVVNIAVSKTAPVVPTMGVPNGRFQQRRGETPFDEFFGRFFDMPGATQAPQEIHGLGSGFLVDASGYVVTNNHVVDDATTITVTLPDERQFDATLIGRDEKTDLALLKIGDGENLPYVSLGDSDRTRVGDWVLAIGNPFGLGGTATAGIVSARGRDIQSGPYDDYIQIDAPINSGNSGGPVFNAAGEVIGVNTAIYSPSGGSVGIGFAIPANQVKTIVAELRERGVVNRGWLGVQIQGIDKDLAASLELPTPDGALIAEVMPGSPAAREDLRAGDVVTRFNGKVVDSPRTLSRMVGDSDPNEQAQLTIWRDGAAHTVRVTLGQAESVSASAAPTMASHSAAAKFGLQLQNLDNEARGQLGLSDDVEGVVVVGVDGGSPAARKGIEPGDVLIAVDGKAVADVTTAATAIERAAGDSGRAMLLLRRDGEQRFVSLSLS